jgi:hypothetical protein
LTSKSSSSDSIVDSDLLEKVESYLRRIVDANEKIDSMRSDLNKYSNFSYNEENINSFDQREFSNKLIESLKNETDFLKREISDIRTKKDEKDVDVNKVLLSTVDNIINSHKAINNSLNIIDLSLKSALEKLEKKSNNLRNFSYLQYITLTCLVIIFLFLVHLFKRLSENPVIVRKKVDHEKIFDSIV